MKTCVKGNKTKGDNGTLVNKSSVVHYPGLEDVYDSCGPIIIIDEEAVDEGKEVVEVVEEGEEAVDEGEEAVDEAVTLKSLNEKNCKELRKICSLLNIKGRSNMKKATLITSILKVREIGNHNTKE